MKKKKEEPIIDSGMEFLKALNAITEDKGISKDLIIDAMKQALATAYKKNYDSKTNVRVDFDETTGEFKVISYYVVVEDYIEPTYKINEEGKEVEIPPETVTLCGSSSPAGINSIFSTSRLNLSPNKNALSSDVFGRITINSSSP